MEDTPPDGVKGFHFIYSVEDRKGGHGRLQSWNFLTVWQSSIAFPQLLILCETIPSHRLALWWKRRLIEVAAHLDEDVEQLAWQGR